MLGVVLMGGLEGSCILKMERLECFDGELREESLGLENLMIQKDFG